MYDFSKHTGMGPMSEVSALTIPLSPLQQASCRSQTNDPENALNAAVAQVFDYHERTKHRFDGYARGPETLDWEAQPDPFRRYREAPQQPLPLQRVHAGPSFASLVEEPLSEARDWNPTSLSRLLQYSLALSAWKEFGGSRWSLRVNPSSGGLHPTECYLCLIGVPGLADGLYHYRADRHCLELRCRYPADAGLRGPLVLAGLSSVAWREAWKYGERAYRYCQLDLGHALAAISYSAALLGRRTTPLLEAGSLGVARLLGLDRSHEFPADEPEIPELLLLLHPTGTRPDLELAPLLQASDRGEWYGRANRLDPDHRYAWPLLEEISRATQRPAGRPERIEAGPWPAPLPPAQHPNARGSAQRLILQRRSAQAMDPDGSLSAEDFFRLLDRSLPRPDLPPWSALLWPSRLHPVLFVHGVDGLAPGLYLLVRRPGALEGLKGMLRQDLLWQAVTEAPAHLSLFCLARANARRTSKRLSCLQAIAGNGAFSLAMLAEFEAPLRQAPWRYNELLIEAGMLGQVLYLEAEAVGMRGTGIGCFIDDGLHELLGIGDRRLQVVYQFTVGLPREDARLASLPPYPGPD
jgi:SagB-type dehydrogenase family enzyme